jgi:predicted lipoprotein with Yx(FWY)xxD motif
MQKGLLAAAGLGSIVVALSGCGIIGGSSTSQANAGSAYGGAKAASTSGAQAGAPMQSATVLKVEKTKIGNVLANSKGMTLYWFSRDVRGLKSACTGQCLAAWPALTGQPVQPSGVKLSGVLGTLDRADGTVQATYNGYPLYTYVDDKTPGQVTGNGQGGVWHVITGKVLTSMVVSGSSGSGSGGGYGYGTGTSVGNAGTHS